VHPKDAIILLDGDFNAKRMETPPWRLAEKMAQMSKINKTYAGVKQP